MTVRICNFLVLVVLVIALPAQADVKKKDTIASLEDEVYQVRPGKLIVNSNNEARSSYRAFLDLLSDDPMLRAEAMRRLADLELESTEASELAENVDTLNHAGYGSAVGLFHELLEAYPDYRRNDTVLYQLARAYEYDGKTDDALRVLNELVQRYPNTRLIGEIQFRRGEMLFLKKDYINAMDAYVSVTRFGDTSRFYEQSLYKLGWARFKLAMHEESLDPFFELLDRKVAGIEIGEGEERLEALSRAERELVEDTFRVLSISFSYMEGAETIDSYLGARGYPAYGYVIFINLGDLYLEKERYVDAAETYETFVSLYPDHPKSPLLQVEVIEAYKLGGFPSLVLAGKKDFVERYGVSTSYWELNTGESNASVEAHLKGSLNDLAQYYHAEAQKNGKESDYLEAAIWYRTYLDSFPGQADSANTNFLLAETLFESKDFQQATREYEQTAYSYPPHEKSAEAGYAAILSYRAFEETLVDVAREDWHKQYLDSGLKFADAFPEHPESGAVLTTVSEDLFQQEEFDLAIAVGQMVVSKQPPVDPPLARTAWTVIAHSQFDTNNFAAAESAYYSLRAFTPADDQVARQEIKDRIASSIYKQGELARDAGDLDAAVAHFTRLGEEVPDSDIRATAEYDAAAVLITMAAWGRASSVLESFRRDYPDSEFSDDINQKLAVTYQETGRKAEAAAEFERIARAPATTADVRREAMWKAATLYGESSSTASEERVLTEVVDQYPDPLSESIEARFRLLEIAEANGNAALRTQRLEDIVYADATAGSQRSDRTRFLAAKASLELAEPIRRSFSVMKIKQPLADSVKLKKALMEDVLDAYGKAAAYGVAEVTTAATFRLGEVYQQFGIDLMESERPNNLDELALEQYDMLLEEQTFPFEEKAIDLHKANAARAADGVYDEWVKKSFDELARMMPARYAKMEQGEDVFTALY